MLANLDLADKADANMRQLSGGMKRRVLVAQALVHQPPVIVLDEPTAGVDVELRQTLWKFISRLNREGHTVRADHALPGRSRGAVPAHRHAQAAARSSRWTRTSQLLRRIASIDAALQADGALPAESAPLSRARVTGRFGAGRQSLRWRATTTSSRCWRSLREAGLP